MGDAGNGGDAAGTRGERATRHRRGLLSPLYVSGDEEGALGRWLSTHPAMDERIDRLVERAGRGRPGFGVRG
ncbi:hypothetical protein BRC83_04045 [Halobacteriales archaeon QS_1_68_17]|nr:MAG: hypothetical protein BRC83_04045 [Halobacteriales archaeon QS_1_68_17]